MPPLLSTIVVIGSWYRQIVSSSMPENPNAESPDTDTTGRSDWTTAAATAKPNPTPIVP